MCRLALMGEGKRYIMNINSVTGTSSLYSVGNVDPTQIVQSATDVDNTDAAPTNVSQMGSLMSELQQLSKSDPTKFKQVTSEIADKLKAEAGDATGKADFLNKLADKFQEASKTGDMSSLKPDQGKQGAKGAHHHHGQHSKVSSYAAASQQNQPVDSLAQIIQGALQDASATQAS